MYVFFHFLDSIPCSIKTALPLFTEVVLRLFPNFFTGPPLCAGLECIEDFTDPF